ncbi:MAG TPA: hypothetical protein VN797_06840 [Gemmatimonadaceae bacterium]|nr:hypothetical protein [Gemmatimonadaceae bacterium]
MRIALASCSGHWSSLLTALLVTVACRGPVRDRHVAETTLALSQAIVTHVPGDTFVADTGIRADSSGHLVLPIVLVNACEGEDCETQFTALACGDAVLRTEPSVKAPVVARVARGDTVEVRRTDLHIISPGIVILRRAYVLDSDASDDPDQSRIPRADTLRFAAGDTLYLLRYLELGSWLWWRGRPSSGSEFWAGPAGEGYGGATHRTDSSLAIARSQPKIDVWWLIERQGATSAWWLRDSRGSIRSLPAMKHWGEHCPRVNRGKTR